MYYLLGREIGNGYQDYVSDIERMELTDDPSRAQQVSEAELEMIDMDYLMEQGFLAMEIDRFGLRFSPVLLFRPPMAHYRPRFTPKKSGEMVVRPPRHMQPYQPREKRHDGAHRPHGEKRPDEGRSYDGDARTERADRPGGRFSSFRQKPGRRPAAPRREGGFDGKPHYDKPGASRRADGFDGKPRYDKKPAAPRREGGFDGKPHYDKPGASPRADGFDEKPGYSKRPGAPGDLRGFGKRDGGKPGGFGGRGGAPGKPRGFGGKPGPSGKPGGPRRGGGDRGGRG